MTLVLLGTAALAAEPPPPPTRTVWLGVVRGPLSPSSARGIELRVREALMTYKSIHVVDAAGHPLEERPLAADAAAMAKLVDQGIEHLLGLRYDDAIERLEQAASLFEARLTMLRDHELLHDALLAKAEAQAQSGRRQLAKTTLKRFAALKPSKVPTRETHERRFVGLWRDALRELGHTGLLELQSNPAGAVIQIDGQTLGRAPVTSRPLRPGTHYVVARWPSFAVTRSVQLGPGSTMALALEQTGPAARARRALRDAIARRRGTTTAEAAATKIFQIASAGSLFVAAVRRMGEGHALYLARHGADGKLIGIGRTAIDPSKDSATAVRRLTAAFLVDGRTSSFELDPLGAATEASDLAESLYGRARADDTDIDLHPDVASLPAGDAPAPMSAITSTATQVAASSTPISEAWWFWTLIGVVVVGGAATAYALVPRDASSTNIQVTLPPR